MQQRDKLFINGKWVAPQGKGVIEVIHSATEAVMGTIPEGSAADAEAAVAAARAAFDGWSATPVAKRAEYIQTIADGLKARSEELAQLIAGEVGMPIKLARAIQVGGPVFNWGNFAKLLGKFAFEEQVGNSLVVREPVGVVGPRWLPAAPWCSSPRKWRRSMPSCWPR
jgi:acyl-CoA reductase-like NAD-dependent aldehyde dehydrogenase